jgi:anti-sigma regulatory factor (Ser/Thr protein kinase)
MISPLPGSARGQPEVTTATTRDGRTRAAGPVVDGTPREVSPARPTGSAAACAGRRASTTGGRCVSEERARAWVEARPPRGSDCTTWSPGHLSDLSAVRREFRAWIADATDDSPRPRENRIEESVLALDELMSNALRHGRSPVEVEVCTSEGGVLLKVVDHAVEDPPQPTSTRDPSDGGMGLGMIADFAVDCGWYAPGDQKVVWAVMPSSEA